MKFLFATDGSPASINALKSLAPMFNNDKDELIIISIADPEYKVIADGQLSVVVEHPAKGAHNSIVSHALQQAQVEYGITNVSTKVLFGDPREEIVNFAKSENVDTIVMGSRGLGAIKRLLLGSISDYVLKNAHCHVLITKQ